MKNRIPPVLAAVFFAAGAALLAAAAAGLPLRTIPRPAILNASLFLCLAAYAAFLARRSGGPLQDLAAPICILSAVLVTAGSVADFVVPAAAVLSWIRSGICFRGPAQRRILAEALTCPPGLLLAAALRPPGGLGWALSVWLFFLVQAAYFALVDAEGAAGKRRTAAAAPAPARTRAAELIRERRLERVFAELELSSRPDFDRSGS
jgi:hypothetical protein